MKRIKADLDLYVSDIDNVKKAILNAAKTKHNRSEIVNILENIDISAVLIQNMILTNTFKASPYRYKNIIDNGKERSLTIPKFYPDQIVHHILIECIENKLMKIIDPYTSSSIPGRGRVL